MARGDQDSISAAALAVGDLHRRGWVHGTLTPWRIWIRRDDRKVSFLLLSESRRVRSSEIHGPVDDFGSLFACLPLASFDEDQRRAFLIEASRRGRFFRRAVRVAEIAFRARGLAPRTSPWVEAKTDAGALFLHPVLVALGAPGRDEELIEGGRSQFLRRIEKRANVKITVEERGLAIFTKEHDPELLGPSTGLVEWGLCHTLRGAGIPTPVPAAGGALGRGSVFASFAIPEGRPLDRLLERRGLLLSSDRRRLLSQLAELVGRFHELGFWHRDFYLCHVFWGAGGLRLIDLARVEESVVLSRRRRVKDLAALLYSSWPTCVTHHERLRFLALYAKRQGRREKRSLAGAVCRKAKRIRRHAGEPKIGGDPV